MKNCTIWVAINYAAVAALSWGLSAFPEADETVRAVAEFGVIVAGVVAVFGALAIVAGAAIAGRKGAADEHAQS